MFVDWPYQHCRLIQASRKEYERDDIRRNWESLIIVYVWFQVMTDLAHSTYPQTKWSFLVEGSPLWRWKTAICSASVFQLVSWVVAWPASRLEPERKKSGIHHFFCISASRARTQAWLWGDTMFAVMKILWSDDGWKLKWYSMFLLEMFAVMLILWSDDAWKLKFLNWKLWNLAWCFHVSKLNSISMLLLEMLTET